MKLLKFYTVGASRKHCKAHKNKSECGRCREVVQPKLAHFACRSCPEETLEELKKVTFSEISTCVVAPKEWDKIAEEEVNYAKEMEDIHPHGESNLDLPRGNPECNSDDSKEEEKDTKSHSRGHAQSSSSFAAEECSSEEESSSSSSGLTSSEE